MTEMTMPDEKQPSDLKDDLTNALYTWREYQDQLAGTNPYRKELRPLAVFETVENAIRRFADAQRELAELRKEVAFGHMPPRQNSRLAISSLVRLIKRYVTPPDAIIDFLRRAETRAKNAVERLESALGSARSYPKLPAKAQQSDFDNRTDAYKQLEDAIRDGIAAARSLDPATAIIMKGLPIVPKGIWGLLVWRWPMLSHLLLVGLGVFFLAILSYQQSRFEQLSIDNQMLVVDEAARSSQENLAIVARSLKQPLPDIDTVADGRRGTTEDSVDVVAALENSRYLNASAYEALKQVFSAILASGDPASAPIAVQLRRSSAIGQVITSVTIDVTHRRTVREASSTSRKTTDCRTPPASPSPCGAQLETKEENSSARRSPDVEVKLRLPSSELAKLIALQAQSLCQAIRASSISQNARCRLTRSSAATSSTPTTPSSHPDTNRASPAEPGAAEEAFQGRSPLSFLVKLAFATSYLMIGCGLVLILIRLFNLTDAKDSLGAIVSGTVSSGLSTTTSLIASAILAPIGLATGFLLAPTDEVAKKEKAAVATDSTVVVLDSLANGRFDKLESLLKELDAAAAKSAKVLDDVSERAN